MTDPHNAPADVPPSRWRWAVCALLLFATTLNYMDRVALNQTSVRIRQSIGLTDREYGFLESAFSLAFGLGTITTGWLVDRHGARLIYPLAVSLWSLAGFATGWAGTFATLLVCRFALGLFEAGNWPCGIRTVRQVMHPSERPFGNSLFQSGTAIGAILTPLVVLLCIRWADPVDPLRQAAIAFGGGGTIETVGPASAAVWQLPFRVIGLLGFVWVIAWLMLPRHVLTRPMESTTSSSGSYWTIFRDRRFWILVTVVIGVNVPWHSVRIWMPKFLQEQAGSSEVEMQWFSMLYYLCADIGSWTVGLGCLALARGGVPVHTARMVAFALCTLLVLLALAIPQAGHGRTMSVILLLVGFGALGLFPIYFALSQELSAAHQGKVTGTLGLINALAMAGMQAGQGFYAQATKRYDLIISVGGLVTLAAFAATVLYWTKRKR